MAETKVAGTDPAVPLYESDFYRWTETMAARLRGRGRLADLLEESPSLKPRLPAMRAKVYGARPRMQPTKWAPKNGCCLCPVRTLSIRFWI